MPKFFVAPGLGKSFLVKNNPAFIDCDTIIETMTGISAHVLANTNPDRFEEEKRKVVQWHKEHFSNKILVTGKAQCIKYCDIIFIPKSAKLMSERVNSTVNRNNPLGWNEEYCKQRINQYMQLANTYNKVIEVVDGYISNEIKKYIRL